MFDFNLIKKPQEYGDGYGQALGRPLSPQEVHMNFVALGIEVNDHEGRNITSQNAVHGILQGHGGGFNADLLDGKHVSELVHSVIDNAIDTASVSLQDAATTVTFANLGIPDGSYRFSAQTVGNYMFLHHIDVVATQFSVTLYCFYVSADSHIPQPGTPPLKWGQSKWGEKMLGSSSTILVDLWLRRV